MALTLVGALRAGQAAASEGPSAVRRAARAVLVAEPLVLVDYLVLVHPESLEDVPEWYRGPALLARGREGRDHAAHRQRPAHDRPDPGHGVTSSALRLVGERGEQRLRGLGTQPPRGEGPVGGGPREGAVGRERALGAAAGDRPQVGLDGAGVAARDRPGQRGVALPQGVVEGRRQQWAEHAGGRVTPAARSRSSASATSVTRWLAPCASAAW